MIPPLTTCRSLHFKTGRVASRRRSRAVCFFRNFGANCGGGLLAANVRPMTFEFSSSAFIQNANSLAVYGNVANDAYVWESVSPFGPDRATSRIHVLGTVYDGGYSSEGLVSAYCCSTSFLVSFFTGDEPDAHYTATLIDVTYRDFASIVVPGPGYSAALYPEIEQAIDRAFLNVSGMTVSDCVAPRSG